MQKLNFLQFFLILLLTSLCSCQNDTTTVSTAEGEEEIPTDEFLQILGESYVYGYPLVLMDITKDVSTNIETPHPTKPLAPINQLGHFRRFPDHTLTTIVKPNVDTYYSIAWMDLKEEPMVISMPATDRHYLLPMYDAYTNVFASPGTRTTGTDAQDFLIVGPNWSGNTPEGLTLIQAPTAMVWMIGRIQVNSPEDGASTVKDIQDKMRLVPLSAFGKKDFIPKKGVVKKENQNVIPVKAIRNLDVNTFFNRLSQLMADNPPPSVDQPMLDKMAKIGFVPGEKFNISTDNFVLKTKLSRLPDFIHKKFETRRSEPDKTLLTDGWMMVKDGIGTYDVDYERRAYIDFIGIGACLPEDAMYPNCVLDANGNILDADNNYRMHFNPEQIPPVNAFWSLTAYNKDEFLVKNDLNRFALGDRDDLKFNSDGSLDLYIQSKPPEDKWIQNWLPIPDEGPFYLTMRLYWPKKEIMDGKWKIPQVVPVN